jgi:hypothetical protein
MRFGPPLPHRSPERRRRRLAAALERLADEAERPAQPFGAAVPIDRAAVSACRDQLLDTARTLEATSEPVNERGLDLLDGLVRDGASPVYTPLGNGALADAIRHARAALLL